VYPTNIDHLIGDESVFEFAKYITRVCMDFRGPTGFSRFNIIKPLDTMGGAST